MIVQLLITIKIKLSTENTINQILCTFECFHSNQFMNWKRKSNIKKNTCVMYFLLHIKRVQNWFLISEINLINNPNDRQWWIVIAIAFTRSITCNENNLNLHSTFRNRSAWQAECKCIYFIAKRKMLRTESKPMEIKCLKRQYFVAFIG